MIKDLKQVKTKVAQILDEYPVTKDCDKKLWLGYACKFHGLKGILGDKYSAFKDFILDSKTPSFESIRRVRQKYQEEGHFIGNRRTIKKRHEEQEPVIDFIRKF